MLCSGSRSQKQSVRVSSKKLGKREKSAMLRLIKLGSLLSLTMLGSGCAGNTPALIDTGSLCKDWRVYKPRAGDRLTKQSAKTMLGNNEARVVWGCAKLENVEAAS